MGWITATIAFMYIGKRRGWVGSALYRLVDIEYTTEYITDPVVIIIFIVVVSVI